MLPVVAVLVALPWAVSGERTSWSGGFGFDGRLYGDLAQHFFAGIFGHAGVALPGVDASRGHPPQGIDSYYVARVFPSLVVYLLLGALRIARSHSAVVWSFELLNVALAGAIAWFWCRSADRLHLSTTLKLLGVVALVVNFPTVRTATYYPVATDTFAYALGAASLCLWLYDRVYLQAVTTFLVAFTWPSHLPVGLALIAFPYGGPALVPNRSTTTAHPRRIARLAIVVCAAAATAAYAFALAGPWRHLVSAPTLPTAAPSTFVLSVAISAAFLFSCIVWIVPNLVDVARAAPELVRTLAGKRLLVIAVVTVATLVIYHTVPTRAGLSSVSLLESSLEYTTLHPAVFFLAAFGLYGPVLLVGCALAKRLRHEIHLMGLGMTVAVGTFVLGELWTEPRKVIDVYPFFVAACAVALARVPWRREMAVVFGITAVFASRIWLPISGFSYTGPRGLLRFPAQAFYMSTGIWMSHLMWLVHLAAALVGLALFVWLLHAPVPRRPRVRPAVSR